MRTVLSDRHMPRFRALTEPEVRLVTERLAGARVPLPGPAPRTGEELFGACARAGLDQAGVVLTLCRETSPTGLSAIEHLVGRPIQPWMQSAAQARAERPPPKPRGVAVPRGPSNSDWVVVSFVPNPKRPNTAGWERYNLWEVGATVAECIARGMWAADVKWDLDRSFVVLAAPSAPEAQAARAARLAARGEVK